MQSEIILHDRLADLRRKKGLTQRELAKKLSEYLGKDKGISPSAVCSWEVGAKKPPYDILLGFSTYYGVTVDYLLGASSKKLESDNKEKFDINNYRIKISDEELKSGYHNRPVFLVFIDNLTENRWAIYDRDSNCFSCIGNVIIENDPSITCYALSIDTLPLGLIPEKKLSLKEAQKKEQVWIEYSNPSETLTIKFSGWYHVSKEKGAFIDSTGFALPFDGFDICYSVYANKPYEDKY